MDQRKGSTGYRPCHNHFLSSHIQNKIFHLTPLTQYIIAKCLETTPADMVTIPTFDSRGPEINNTVHADTVHARFRRDILQYFSAPAVKSRPTRRHSAQIPPRPLLSSACCPIGGAGASPGPFRPLRPRQGDPAVSGAASPPSPPFSRFAQFSHHSAALQTRYATLPFPVQDSSRSILITNP